MGCSSCSLVEDSSVPEECPEIPATAPGDGLSGSAAPSPALLQPTGLSAAPSPALLQPTGLSAAPSPALLQPTGLDADPGTAGLHFAVLRAQQAAVSSHPWLSTAPLCAQRSSCCFTLKPSPAGREAPLSCSFLSECTDALPFPLVSPAVEEVVLGRPEDGTQPWQSVVEQQAALSGGGQLRAAGTEPGTRNLLQVLAASQHALSHVLAPKGPKDSSLCARERESSMATDRLQSEAASSKGEKSRGGGAAAGRSWRLPAARREKLSAGLVGTASPSQVAMASFAPRQQCGLPVLHRVQVCGTEGEQWEPLGCRWCHQCLPSSAAPTNSSDRDGVFLCKSCQQVFYTQKGLDSHMCFRDEQWLLPQRREEPQVKGKQRGWGARKAKVVHRGGSGAVESPCNASLLPQLMLLLSYEKTGICLESFVQVTPKESQDGKSPRVSSHPKKRKRQILPKPLFIPPPPPPEAQPGPGGCYRSNLRSPVLLMDRLLRDLLQCSPYTPPPMLSPIREGSGLYFNAICSSTAAEPCRLLGSVLDRMDQDFGLCLMKDGTKISIEPHINVGSRFQAEIPTLQDRSRLGNAEHAALVWKPWGDIATNEETQDRVMELLNMACSSVMPGGGTNLELALHCLHEARGNVVDALELLLFGWPHKSQSHPLANYRYTGSDVWTPVERQLFKNAFHAHKKDFYLIQKKVQTKNVSQCVEYYYIWKKIIKFDHSRPQNADKKVKRDSSEAEEAEEKVENCSKRHCLLLSESSKKSCRKTPHSAGSPSCSPGRAPGAVEHHNVFPCTECERVFDKIKGRNAHMKRHRPQHRTLPLLEAQWALEPLKREEAAVGGALSSSWGAVPPQ
uniref:Zinc finger protein 541 n=1 Tax=Phasianus colchicus TaxID=9054 RepID=A0A669QEN9_PHACC